jgi:predicted deacetylase
MRKAIVLAAMGLSIVASDVKAQVDLSAYADAQGFLNVQTLTCAQLANTWQGDADRLAAWYSGWYNGLAHARKTRNRGEVNRMAECQRA